MNIITPTSYEFLCQHINGSTFAADLANVTSYYQINSIEKSKLIEVIEVSTITEASTTEQILAQTLGTNVVLTHPFNTWNVEGFVIGDTVRVEANGAFTTSTVTGILGVNMYIAAGTFFADLSTTDGDARPDYVIKCTTVPTTLIYDYGVIPNDQVNPTFVSPLTGNPLTYAGSGITGALTDIPFTGAVRDDMGTVECKYNGASGTGNYIFEFEIEHTFQNFFYIADWLANYTTNTVPIPYLGANSFKYVSRMNFGTNINNPNDGKIFTDSFQVGSTGLNDQNFNAGVVNYTLDSIAYADGAATLTKINADVSTDVTIVLKNNGGNWGAGERAYLYHSKLLSNSEYTLAADSVTDFETLFVFNSHTNTDGAGASTNGFIVNLLVAIDGGDPTLLNITFTLTYTASELARILQDDPYFLGVGVEDSTTTATTSDRVIVWCDQNTFDISTDITGLITVPQIYFYNATEDLAFATPTSNINTWVNTIHLLTGNFRLTKFPDTHDSTLVSLKIKEVGYYAAESKFFPIQNFEFPLGNFKAGPPTIDVDGTGYQPINVNSTRNIGNIPLTDDLSKVQLSTTIPGAYQNYQLFSWQLGWVVGWRQWVGVQDIEDVAPEFYSNTPTEENNFNQRSSNYSGVNSYEIYFFASAVVLRNGVHTTYNMTSDKCIVKDFDVDILGTGWVQQSYKIYDENGVESDDLFTGQDMTLVVIIDNPGALLTLGNTGGQIIVEVSNSNGEHSRLHTTKVWDTEANLLKPLVGSTNVDISQVAVAPNEVHLACLIKGDKLDEENDYNFYGHLDSL